MKKKALWSLLAGTMILSAGLMCNAAGSGWYEQNGEVLTVYVPLGGGNESDWSVTPNAYDGMDLLTASISDGTWVGSFYLGNLNPGDSRLEILCQADGVLYGYYNVDYSVNDDGSFAGVNSAYGNMDDYNGGAGWTGAGTDYSSDSSSYVDPSEFADPNFDAYTAYVNADDGLMLRSSADTGSEIRGVLAENQEVKVVGMTTNGWAMVVVGDTVGYCNAAFLGNSPIAATDTNTAAPSANVPSVGVDSKMTTAASEEDEKPWYRIDADGKVMTLTLPCEEASGYQWKFTSSDKDMTDLVTQETTDGNTVASFADISGKASGKVRITAEYQKNNDGVIYQSYSADLEVADGRLTLLKERKPWFEVEDATGLLTLHLPYNTDLGEKGWSWQFSDNDTVELVTQEIEDSKKNTAEHTMTASFRATGKQAGAVMLTLTCETTDSMETERELRLFVNDKGAVTVLAVTEETLEEA